MPDAVLSKKHVLGAAKANALGSEFASLLGVAWYIRIGSHSDLSEWLGPIHKLLEFCQILRVGRQQLSPASQHTAGCAFDLNPVSVFENLPASPHLAGSLIDGDFSCAGDAAFAHTTSDDRSVTGDATLRSQDADRNFHSVYIFGSGFGAHQDHRIFLRTMSRFLNCIIGGKNNLPHDCSWRGGQTGLGQYVFRSYIFFVQPRHEEIHNLIGVEAEDRLFLAD